MIINEKLEKELINLQRTVNSIINSNSLTNTQIEGFLRNLERSRYNILLQIKLYNENVEYEYEKIKCIDDEYKIEFSNDILKIYIPEVLPSYKNIKTHTHKRIMSNIAEITKPLAGMFKNEVFIYIKIFDNILGWDIDNKYIKPISDGLILSKIIEDDNINKMFYCAKGEYSENPHTEIYVLDAKNINEFLQKSISEK